jgi:hypothetical protein
MIGEILSIGSKIIDKIFPDKQAAEAAKIKLFELQQQGEFKQLDAELEKERLAIQDVASARQREAQMAVSGKRDYAPAVLAISLTVGFFVLLTLLVFVDVDKEAMTLLEIMLGCLGTAFIQIISYYFGSSSSSRKKDDVISKLKNNISGNDD